MDGQVAIAAIATWASDYGLILVKASGGLPHVACSGLACDPTVDPTGDCGAFFSHGRPPRSDLCMAPIGGADGRGRGMAWRTRKVAGAVQDVEAVASEALQGKARHRMRARVLPDSYPPAPPPDETGIERPG